MKGERQKTARFLEFLIKNRPDYDPPPFFAARVAQLAVTRESDFFSLVSRLAVRLVPFFVSLTLALLFISYQFLAPSEVLASYTSLLIETEDPTPINLEYVLDSIEGTLPENSDAE